MKIVATKAYLLQHYKAWQWSHNFCNALLDSKKGFFVQDSPDEFIWTGTEKEFRTFLKEQEAKWEKES